jgi:phage terminase large subunit
METISKISRQGQDLYVQMVHPEVVQDTTKYHWYYGGRGGGKSKTAARKVAINLWHRAGNRGLVTRKTFPSLRITAMKDVLDAIEFMQIPGEYKASENTFYYDNGSSVLFLPLYEQARRSERLKSLDLNLIWAEEATEMSLDDYKNLKWTMRLPGIRQMIFSFNPPERADHWLYREYERQVAKGQALKVHFDIEDNPLLPEDLKRELYDLKHTDAGLFERYAKGTWGIDVVRDRVWENVHFGRYNGKPKSGGQDWGYSDPSVTLFIHRTDGKLYIMDEIYKRRKQPEEIGAMIEERFKAWGIKKSEFPIHADSANKTENEKLRSMGFWIKPSKKGKGSVNEGIIEARKLEIIIDEERCPNAAREIPNWVYRKDRDGNTLDEPVDFDDHCPACVRYNVLGEKQSRLQIYGSE